MTASEYFDDGNRLFRDDLYWAALLRYRQANAAGLDTPLLHYNMGVAHYKARQHIRSRQSLLKALESPTLRVGAHYNLGLNAYAAGDLNEALRWFRLARDQQQNQRISEYATVAIARIRKQMRDADPIVIHEIRERKKREFANLQLRARISFGNDDNVFRSPEDPYVDLADPTTPTVTPEVKSGVYIPFSLDAKYVVNALTHEGFFGTYRLAGRYYQDKELDNANEFIHEISIGSQYRRKDEEANRERRVYSAFKVAQHDEVYYDPDDGASRDIAGIAIDDRFNYLRYGPELRLRQSYERLTLGLEIVGQLWNYDDVEVVPEYDHEYFRFGLLTQYRFTRTSLLRFTAAKYSRRFGDRPSFDLNGQQLITNPTVRYDYVDFGITARQRITDNFWFGVEYTLTDREDRFVGYNNFVRDSFGAEIHWRVGDRFKFEARGHYRLYDFENAFAFNSPAAGRKTLETADVRIRASYQMTDHLYLDFDARLRDRVSTDNRIEYQRNQLVIGVRWEQ